MKALSPWLLVLLTGCAAHRPTHFQIITGPDAGAAAINRDEQLRSLTVALLRSSAFEAEETVANEKYWQQCGDQPSCFLADYGPRQIRTTVLGDEITVTELRIPIPKRGEPPYLLVRNEQGIRAFAKYDCATWKELEAAIRKSHAEIDASRAGR